jgi:coatomer subunit beta'
VRTGEWVGDCFIYTNSTNRLNYLVGDQTYTVSHFDTPMYILGYILRDGRIYVADKDVNVVSYALSQSVLEYQTVVLRGDMDAAAELLESIEEDQKNKIARFLDGQGYKELALEVATDPEHRFDLALALNQLETALELAKVADVDHKWKAVGDAALTAWNLALAEECFTHGKDLGSLLLLHTSTGNIKGLRALAAQADIAGANNIVFSCLWQLNDIDGTLETLYKTSRYAEAVLLAQTYKPSLAPAVVAKWKLSLEKSGKTKVSRSIGLPPGADGADDDLFPEWDEWLKLESSDGAGETPEKTESKPSPEAEVEKASDDDPVDEAESEK